MATILSVATFIDVIGFCYLYSDEKTILSQSPLKRKGFAFQRLFCFVPYLLV